ncbi:MAG: hypothetical protein M0R22_04875 [Dehalococcoidia bacterium]|jgi:hypothetical protein|nr:hypothetical protein [Dehalococcoidia bacterium]
MRITRATALYCIISGALLLCLWATLFATGQVTDIAERPVAYAFHLTAEASTALLLILSGAAALRGATYARRLFYFAGGMLFIAAMGMLVFYIEDGYPPFIALGAVVVGLTVAFLRRNYAGRSDLLYLALGTALYGEMNALGNVLQTGDMRAALYLIVMTTVTLPVTLLVLRRPL